MPAIVNTGNHSPIKTPPPQDDGDGDDHPHPPETTNDDERQSDFRSGRHT